MRQIIKGLIYTIVLLTPLIVSKGFFFSFVAPKTFFFYFLIEIAFVFWLYGWLTKPKEYIFRTGPVFWAILGFFGVGVISSVFGVNFTESFWSTFERMTGLLTGMHLLIFYVVASSLFRGKDAVIKLLEYSVIGALVTSLFIWIGDAGFDWWSIPGARRGASLGNTSFAGSYLLFNIFFAIYLVWSSRNTKKFWFWLGSLAVIGMSPIFFNYEILSGTLNLSDAFRDPVRFLGHSRAAIVGVGTGLVFSVFTLLAKSSKKKLKIAGSVLLSGLGVLTVAFFILALTPSPVQDFLKSAGTGSRFITWQVGIDGALERPILGYGVSNYGRVFQEFYNPDILLPENGRESWFDKSHNIVVDAAAETGFVGLVALFAVYGIAIFVALRKKEDKELVLLGVLVSGALIAHLLQGITVFDMLPSFLMFYLSLILISSTDEKEQGVVPMESLLRHKNTISIVLAVVLIGMVTYFVALPMRSNRAVIKIFDTVDLDKRMRLHEIAYKTPVGRTHVIRNVGGQMRDVLQQSFVAIKRNSWEELALREVDFIFTSLEEHRDDAADSVRNYVDLIQWANFYELFDVEKYEEANKYGEKAIALSPANPYSYWALAQSKINQGEPDEAVALVETVLEANPDLDEAIEIHSNLLRSIGR
jgi:O-antigen ligase